MLILTGNIILLVCSNKTMDKQKRFDKEMHENSRLQKKYRLEI